MKRFTQVKFSGLFLAGLCLVSVFALGTGSASAARPILLFLPASHKFPYHLVGTGGQSVLETVSGQKLESPKLHTLALVLNSTLFNLRIEFLETKPSAGGKCQTAGSPGGTVVINLLGHLGLIDPGLEAGVLLLIPVGFAFTCTEVPLLKEIKVQVKGSVIGLITSPAIGVASELLTVKFEQEKGVQRWTTFLLGESQLINQFQETSLNGGVSFEKSGQSGEATLHALPGEGKFTIVLDP